MAKDKKESQRAEQQDESPSAPHYHVVSPATFALLEEGMQRACAEAGLPKGSVAVGYDRARMALIWRPA